VGEVEINNALQL